MSRSPSPLTGQPSLFTVRSALEAGLSPDRLRASDLEPAGRSLRVIRGSEVLWHDRLRAVQELNPTGVFSHATAARLWSMWVPTRMTEDPLIHLAKVRGVGGRASREGIRPHQLEEAAEVVERDGLRLTSPAWTWVDLAKEVSLEDLVVAGDSLLPSEHGAEARHLERLPDRALTVDALRRMAARRRNVRGVVKARAAVDLLRTGADSPAESRLRHRIVEAGFPEPEVNPTLRLRDGRLKRPDLCWRSLRLCLEFDGDQHRTDESQWQEDRARRRGLEAEEWAVMWVAGEALSRAGWPAFRRDLSATMHRRALRYGVALPPSFL